MKNSIDKSRFGKLLLILLILILYFLFTRLAGFGIPCVFHLLTGLSCPGCGISRMFLSLAKGDFRSAFRFNAFVFCFLPLFLTLLLYWTVGWLTHRTAGEKGRRIEKVLYVGLAGALILWGIVRNIIGM